MSENEKLSRRRFFRALATAAAGAGVTAGGAWLAIRNGAWSGECVNDARCRGCGRFGEGCTLPPAKDLRAAKVNR
jgi:predicted RNA methylase